MRKNLVRKAVVCGIIFLFFGTSILPSIGKNIEIDNKEINGKSITEKGTSVNVQSNNLRGDGGATLNLTQGLIGYWNFNEGNSNIAHDTSGYGNDGTIVGASWVSGISGSALEITNHGYVGSISSSFDNPISTAFTIAAWVKWYGPSPFPHNSLIFDGRADLSDGFSFYISPDTSKLGLTLNQPNSGILSGTSIPIGSWAFVVGVFNDDSNILRLYINGVLDMTATTTMHHLDSSENAMIGNNHWAPGDGQWAPLNGVEDEVRLYNRELSASEILYLYQNPGGGGNQPNMDLFVEDALDPVTTTIWKAPGDRVDIVFNVSNSGSTTLQTFTLNLDISGVQPSGSYMGMVKCFTRDSFYDITNEKNITSNCSQSGNSFTVATNNIPNWPGIPVNGIKQFVFRLSIPNNAPSYTHIHTVDGTLTYASGSISKEVTYKITTSGQGIIITNRYLLYKNYGGTSKKNHEVQSLLQYLFVTGDYSATKFIVYYVDHYDDSFKNWAEDYLHPSLNAVAIQIDNYIRSWTARQIHWGYVLLVGGDEIIPYWRIHDPLNDEITDQINVQDWVLNSTCKDYYISDNGYQTILNGGNPVRWLMAGRIVGLNASQMQSFIKNGIERKPKNNKKAVVANEKNGQAWNVDFVVSALEGDGWKLVNKSVVTNKYNWNKSKLIAALQEGPQIFAHFCHEGYSCLWTPSNDALTDVDFSTLVNIQGCISNNNTFLFLDGCQAGMVPNKQFDTSMIMESVKAGISGAVAAGGITHFGKGTDMAAGDLFGNVFFIDLIQGWPQQTGPIGQTYFRTLYDYPLGVNGSYPDMDQKTLNEYIVYGVPWMQIPKPGSDFHKNTRNNKDYTIEMSKPVSLGNGNYCKKIYVNISQYYVNSSGGFDYIYINGSRQEISILKPQIPIIDTTINLSNYSYFIQVTPVANTSTDIGAYTLPSSNITPGVDELNLTNDTDVVGYYPPAMCSANLSYMGDYNRLRMCIAPIKHNPLTKDTLIFNTMEFNVTYHLSTPIALTQFTTHDLFAIGEPFQGTAIIENAGSETLTNLRLNLSIQNINNNACLYTLSTPFTLTGGEATNISTTINQTAPGGGGYLARAQIMDSDGTILATAQRVIYISSGEITNFTYPETIAAGDIAQFTIQFKNNNLTAVNATGTIHVYNSGCSMIADLISPPIYVSPFSSENISLVWGTTGVAPGQYTITEMVNTSSEKFTTALQTMVVNSGSPVFGTPTPANGSTNNSVSLTWSIPINDHEGDLFSWSIQCSNGQTNSGAGASNGTKTLALSGLGYSTTYKVWVNATDPAGSGLWTRGWYTFTTKVGNSVFINENFSGGVPPAEWTTDYWSLDSHSYAGGVAPEAELNWVNIPGTTAYLKTPVINTTSAPTLTLDFKSYISHYLTTGIGCYVEISTNGGTTWTDITPWTNPVTTDVPAASYSINVGAYISTSTQVQFRFNGNPWYLNWWDVDDVALYGPAENPPVFGTPSPANSSTDNPLNLTWSIPINDPESDQFSWTIQCSNGQTNSATGATNGIKSLSLSGLAYSTTYMVWVNATDPGGSGLYTRRWYQFTTKINNPPTFGTPNPVNGSTDNPLNLTWSIPINDPEGDIFNWTIQCSNGQNNSGNDATNGTKSIALSDLGYSTTYKVWVNATDLNGSGMYTRRWYTFTTVLDITPPITTILLNGTMGNNSWYISPVTVTLTANDTESGVDYTLYKIDDGNWTTYAGLFVISDDGEHNISYYSVDNAGNAETTRFTDVKIDTSLPVTTHTFSGAVGNNNWFTSNITITLSATDSNLLKKTTPAPMLNTGKGSSGINHTYSKIDNGSWAEYHIPITVSVEGYHNLSYYSIDNAGNIEPVKGPFLFKIDKTPPTITLTKQQIDLIDIKFTAQVSDNTSGIDRVEFFLDGVLQSNDTQSPYEWRWTGFGNHQVTATVFDLAGNSKSQSMSTPLAQVQGMNAGQMQISQQQMNIILNKQQRFS